ncbi:MAG: hypothetical protein WCG83_01535 [Candidatus Peregrinibacteria bacterium]
MSIRRMHITESEIPCRPPDSTFDGYHGWTERQQTFVRNGEKLQPIETLLVIGQQRGSIRATCIALTGGSTANPLQALDSLLRTLSEGKAIQV